MTNRPGEEKDVSPVAEWARSRNDDYTYIYTDGSYKEHANWGEILLDNPRVEADGAIILSDGKNWFYKIHVIIDLKVKDAGQNR